MEYIAVESELKTSRDHEYLWNKISTPEKLIQLEEFCLDRGTAIKRISTNLFEIMDEKDGRIIFTFIPERGVSLVQFDVEKYPLVWFDIIGNRNCEVRHGAYLRIDGDEDRITLEKGIENLKKHFLEELEEIAE